MTDPRIRQRRIEVARAAGRRRLRVILASLAVLSLAAGTLAALHSPLFSVRRITIVGAPGLQRATVIAASGLGSHPPLVDVDTAHVEQRLRALPEVATAAVHEQWPSGVEIVLTERRPVAAAPVAFAGGRAWVLVDATGRVLASSQVQPVGLPVVLLPEPPGRAGTYLPGAALPLVSVAAAIPASVEPILAAVGLDRAGDIVLQLVGRPAVILGGDGSLPQKLVSLTTILADVDLKGVSTIDLSVPAAPVLTEIGHGPTVQVINGG